MSSPDPLYDEENTMSQDSFDRFDDMAERTIWPWIDDASDEYLEDDAWHLEGEEPEIEMDDEYDYDESMDGDHDSAMESAGWGTDEDYGFYGEDY
jgi:hypothetical protein